MLKEIKRQIRLNRADYISVVASAVGAALLADVIVMIVLAFNPGAEVPALGPVILSSVAMLVVWILVLGAFATQFNLAIKMGAVRRNFVLARLVMNFILAFGMMLLAYPWRFLSRWLIGGLAGGTIIFDFVFSPGLAAVLSLAIVCSGMWLGAMFFRYGKVAFWVVWAITVLPGIFINQITDAATDPARTDLAARAVKAAVAWAVRFPAVMFAAIGLLVLMAISGHSWGVLRKIPAQD